MTAALGGLDAVVFSAGVGEHAPGSAPAQRRPGTPRAPPRPCGERGAGAAHDLRRLALAHPHVVPLMVTRPLALVEAEGLDALTMRPLRPVEQLLARLVGAGFTPADALHVYRAYFGFLYGHVGAELQELLVDPTETTDLLRQGLHRLPPGEFRQLRALATALVDYDGAAELDQGLEHTADRTARPAARHDEPPSTAQLRRRRGAAD